MGLKSHLETLQSVSFFILNLMAFYDICNKEQKLLFLQAEVPGIFLIQVEFLSLLGIFLFKRFAFILQLKKKLMPVNLFFFVVCKRSSLSWLLFYLY